MSEARHGGCLSAAARRWGLAPAAWLDLSTGIAPWSWPVPEVPGEVWARLPEPDDGLEAAAAACYDVPRSDLLAVPGSQYAIRALPRQVPPGCVAVPRTGYTEHAAAWAAAGHRVCHYDDTAALAGMVSGLDHAVVIAPNNPTGEWPPADRLAVIAEALGPQRLIVDAAFAGCRNVRPSFPETAIVLRSVGKFFGLAGLRLGFVSAAAATLSPLAADIRPWGVSHPARWIGVRALADGQWQSMQRHRIARAEDALVSRLRATFGSAAGIVSGGLFVSVFFDAPGPAAAWHEALARRAILTRLGDDGHWLRFGLAPDDQASRLATALAAAADEAPAS
ncbi:aminotransferase class I/II-fold pyridoxal phosphate-dependent enzyme [Salinisphaera sp. Q1T1-3]|uniref:aminotransferase class I/II-fold pyridoxal phosphate-dependent enzyme n=1 Tax=Salinisphaera sp. Q1T1-3 TaxID=2321229 RepID=UPI000E70A2E4|nr:aminotransferase class I/II-fold pyridoxal phosphate-dependent enzyme [Salinisphaera sp. Q1T1-3]RJS92516.1 aminotransferase class I/II-fold pyridoxal phosphate-dependent enzyme [Salinisphaera sp. Q1T1-3]